MVDTGSPFLLVAGTADCANPDLDRTTGRGGLTLGTKWGCYRLGGPTRYNGVQGSLNDMSEERYGGQVRHDLCPLFTPLNPVRPYFDCSSIPIVLPVP